MIALVHRKRTNSTLNADNFDLFSQLVIFVVAEIQMYSYKKKAPNLCKLKA